VLFEGMLQRAKYPATVVVQKRRPEASIKAYYFGGVREEPFNATYNVQVFNTKIGVIDFTNFQKDHGGMQAKSVSEPLPRNVPTSRNNSNSPFIDLELVRERVVAMGKPDPKLAFQGTN
jgi:hypothetical protein